MTERTKQIDNIINSLADHFKEFTSGQNAAEFAVGFLLENELMFVPMEGTEEEISPIGEFYGIPKASIPALVAKYIQTIENEKSNRWCRCEWIIHPEDIKKPENSCLMDGCGKSRDDKVHENPQDFPNAEDNLEYVHWYRGRRMRRGDEYEYCAVHTKRGLVMGFFEWLFTQEDPELVMWDALPESNEDKTKHRQKEPPEYVDVELPGFEDVGGVGGFWSKKDD